MIPYIRGNMKKSVTVPQLTGGINMRDNVTKILDNQLTDGTNIWFEDGFLKTRPGVVFCGEYNATDELGINGDYFNVKAHEVYKYDGAARYTLVTVHSGYTHQGTGSSDKIHTFWVGENSAGETSVQWFGCIDFDSNDSDKFFFVQKSNLIYCFATGLTSPYKYDLNAQNPSWVVLNDSDIYAPKVLLHGKIEQGADGVDWSGVNFESYNIIGDYYRMIYSHYNPNYEGPLENERNEMIYALKTDNVNNPSDYAGKKITAKIKYVNGQIATHEVTLDSNGAGHETTVNTVDNIAMWADLKQIYFADSGEAVHSVIRLKKGRGGIFDSYVEDNLEITAPYLSAQKDKVFNMTKSVWFGGAAAGIQGGGSRLFLGGNTEEENKSLVIWSDLDNPLYFPENNYFYVGNNTGAVTGFGKQNETLVIFKPDEIFYTKYIQGDSVSADDLINQDVIDIAAASAKFPLIQLHSAIGCDCPDSIQLCRNRLVWAHTSGHVYTLVTENQFSERNVYDISEMISKKLENLNGCFSADHDGKYYLFSGNDVFVMDYNSYGYSYISSYSKTDDANLRVPWFCWRIPRDFDSCCAVENNLYLFRDEVGLGVSRFVKENGADSVLQYNSGTRSIVETPIACFLKTKVFDFGYPNNLKNIFAVNFNFGDNGGIPIRVSFLTESSDEANGEYLTPVSAGTEYDSSRFVQTIRYTPCLRGNTRFGIRLDCEGQIYVDTIGIQYSITGGAK